MTEYLFLLIVLSITSLLIPSYWKKQQFIKQLASTQKGLVNIVPTSWNFGLGGALSFLHQIRLKKAYDFVVRLLEPYWTKGDAILADSSFFANTIHISDPASVKFITVSKALKFPKADAYSSLKVALGEGLVTSQGDIWKRQRGLLNNVFTNTNIAKMNTTMRDLALDYVNKLENSLENSSTTIQFEKRMSELTLRIVTASVFGGELEFIEKMAQLWNSVVVSILPFVIRNAMLPIYKYLPIPSTLQLKKDINEITGLVHQIISHFEKKIANENCLDENGVYESKDGNCYLMPLLLTMKDESGKHISKQQIIDECLTFLFAGHDTTSSLLSFTFWMLASHPTIQDKCYQEIKAKLNPLQHTEITEPDFQELTYCKQVLNESLRCYPPVRAVSKKTEEDLQLPNGYFVPSGTQIMLNILGLHRNPNVWENPNKFDPERWNEEKLAKTFADGQLRYSHIPFSLGFRNCIGKEFAFNEALVITSLMLQRFKVELTPEAEKELYIQTSIVSTPSYLFLKFTKRQ